MTVQRLRSNPRILALALSLLMPMLSACEDTTAAYNRGVSDGRAQASAAAESSHAEGHRAGYREGFEAARPPATPTAPIGVWHIVSIVVTILGMAKIILSLLVFVLFLIFGTPSGLERLAKMIATSLAMVVVFWLSNSFTIGFSQPLTDALLAPAATTPAAKLVTGLLAALLTWAAFWALEFVASLSEPHAYVQTALVIVASGLISILIPLFVSLYAVPNINGYRFFDLVVGVVIGGILWLVHRLLVESNSESTEGGPAEAA